MGRMKTIALLVLPMVWCSAMVARADDADDAKREISKLWNIDQMMDQAANNIARRYNLNQEQREYTHKMLTQRVTRFLDGHPEIWPLIRDMARYQMRGEAPDGEIAKRIGMAAQPLLKDIQDEILSANKEWGQMLTPEQKKVHEWDLRDMERTFSKMQKNFSSMADGQSVEQGIFPKPNTEEPQPTIPPRPADNWKPNPPNADAHTESKNLEDWWDAYVREFIRRHSLDDAQAETAWSILRELKGRARTYRLSKAKDFKMLEQRMSEVHRRGQPPEVLQARIEAYEKMKTSLNKPILDLFQELQQRLERIPRSVQKQADGTGTDEKPKGDATKTDEQMPQASPSPSPTPEAQPEAAPPE